MNNQPGPVASEEFFQMLDLSLYCSSVNRFNARQYAKATIRRWAEEDAVGALARDFNYRQRIRRVYLGPIAEPRQLGKKR